MTKTYVLDTSVILHDAESIFKFEENTIIIPQTVLQEIDKHKRDQNEVGRNARAFSRYLDDLRQTGNLSDCKTKGQGGVVVNDKGGILKVDRYYNLVAKKFLPDEDLSVFDNRILACALKMQSCFDEVTIVSNDTNMRILGDIWGLNAESYKNDRVSTDEMYSGLEHVTIATALIDKVYDDGKLDVVEFALESGNDPLPNQCFVLHGDCNLKQSALVRYNSVMQEYKLLPQDQKTFDIMPRNTEQQFLLDILKDPEIVLVSVNGKAGSGKTLLTLAAALHDVVETQRYNKIVLLKPIISMDNAHDIGFLPGTLEEKMAPWMASYSDNLDVIMAGYLKDEEKVVVKKPKLDNKQSKQTKQTQKQIDAANDYFAKEDAKTSPMQELISLGLLEIGSLQNIRGRSLPKQIIIVDETQNLTRKGLKTIVTRIGEGSKVILLGDISQIDNPYLDDSSNALSIIAEVSKPLRFTAHITLKKSERSELAEVMAELL